MTALNCVTFDYWFVLQNSDPSFYVHSDGTINFKVEKHIIKTARGTSAVKNITGYNWKS